MAGALESPIQAGDIVRLKSGSDPMTVGKIDGNEIATTYFQLHDDNGVGHFYSAVIPIAALEKFQDEEEDP